jgi:AraC-like DNA-binding protein
MQHAVQLLDHSFLSIKEIAGRIGYTDQAYFSNDFKKFYRLSPGEWRKKKNISTP